MAAPAIIEWFGQGIIPAVLLGVGGLAHALPKQSAMIDQKLFGGITVRTVVGALSVVAAVALFMN